MNVQQNLIDTLAEFGQVQGRQGIAEVGSINLSTDSPFNGINAIILNNARKDLGLAGESPLWITAEDAKRIYNISPDAEAKGVEITITEEGETRQATFFHASQFQGKLAGQFRYDEHGKMQKNRLLNIDRAADGQQFPELYAKSVIQHNKNLFRNIEKESHIDSHLASDVRKVFSDLSQTAIDHMVDKGFIEKDTKEYELTREISRYLVHSEYSLGQEDPKNISKLVNELAGNADIVTRAVRMGEIVKDMVVGLEHEKSFDKSIDELELIVPKKDINKTQVASVESHNLADKVIWLNREIEETDIAWDRDYVEFDRARQAYFVAAGTDMSDLEQYIAKDQHPQIISPENKEQQIEKIDKIMKDAYFSKEERREICDKIENSMRRNYLHKQYRGHETLYNGQETDSELLNRLGVQDFDSRDIAKCIKDNENSMTRADMEVSFSHREVRMHQAKMDSMGIVARFVNKYLTKPENRVETKLAHAHEKLNVAQKYQQALHEENADLERASAIIDRRSRIMQENKEKQQQNIHTRITELAQGRNKNSEKSIAR